MCALVDKDRQEKKIFYKQNPYKIKSVFCLWTKFFLRHHKILIKTERRDNTHTQKIILTWPVKYIVKDKIFSIFKLSASVIIVIIAPSMRGKASSLSFLNWWNVFVISTLLSCLLYRTPISWKSVTRVMLYKGECLEETRKRANNKRSMHN